MICSPSCNSDQVCTKKSMTDCGICPALLCMSRTALGLPPLATSSDVSSSDQGSSNETGVLVGGILGGLVGFGILVGIGIYCYIKKNKRGKLPFAFTSGNASHIVQSQEKFHQSHLQSPQQVTPHPAVIAALSHQSTITTTSSSSRYIGLANLANGGHLQRQPSMTSTANNHVIQTPLYNTDTHTNTTSSNTSTSNTAITGNVPEEFESKIALQNKRISEILYNNPRLSQQPQPLPQPHIQHAQQRYSAYTTTDDDFDDDEEDRRSTLSTSTTQSNYLPQTATATSLQAIQVARAKPQIMRVNSVKSTSGLNRSESVRTVLTAIEDIQDFPSTPTRDETPVTTTTTTTTAKATSAHEDNPFADKHADNTTH